MLKEAIDAGLIVDQAQLHLILGQKGVGFAAPDPRAMIHNSLTGAWWLAEILWKRHYDWQKQHWERRPNLGRRRTIPPNSLIHESTYRRDADYIKKLPEDGIPTS
jgi:hypothetical protein